MTRARIYPPANRTAQWWENNFTRKTMPVVDKLLLHTTETGKSWPGYDSGASAPTVTYNPWMESPANRWRQHNYLNTSARALRDSNATAVRENQDGVVQVEIICYCDPKLAKKYGYFVGDLPDHAYEDLGHFLWFLATEWQVPLVRAGEWDLFPPSDSIRMSGPEYDAFRGLLGHQHASSNTHGDPGMTNAQVDRIITVAKRLSRAGANPTTPEPPKEGDLTMADIKAITDRLDRMEKNQAQFFDITGKRWVQDINEQRGGDQRNAERAEADRLRDVEQDKAIAELKTLVQSIVDDPNSAVTAADINA